MQMTARGANREHSSWLGAGEEDGCQIINVVAKSYKYDRE